MSRAFSVLHAQVSSSGMGSWWAVPGGDAAVSEQALLFIPPPTVFSVHLSLMASQSLVPGLNRLYNVSPSEMNIKGFGVYIL